MKLEISPIGKGNDDTSHDRLSVLRDAHCTLIALADGVNSGAAAQTAAARTVNELARCFRNGTLSHDPRDWVMVLEAIDAVVFSDPDAGETNALVILVQQEIVVGASVGNSLAYIVTPAGEAELLTKHQRRGPHMGTGLARPVGFGPVQLDGRLITRRASRFHMEDGPATIGARRASGASASLAGC